jgi:hypothetical protein
MRVPHRRCGLIAVKVGYLHLRFSKTAYLLLFYITVLYAFAGCPIFDAHVAATVEYHEPRPQTTA